MSTTFWVAYAALAAFSYGMWLGMYLMDRRHKNAVGRTTFTISDELIDRVVRRMEGDK